MAREVFLPQTKPNDPSEARLLIVDGHGSHTSDLFMATCYLNNVYLLFLPAHTSHMLQPLDLGSFITKLIKIFYYLRLGIRSSFKRL